MEIKFNDSDCWLLQVMIGKAIDKIVGQVSLGDIIADGDQINHAIFTHGELQNSMYKLHKAGYLKKIGKDYKLTPFGKNMFGPIKKMRKTVMKERDEISKLLNAEPWSDKKLAKYNPKLRPRFFTPEEFDRAYKEYCRI